MQTTSSSRRHYLKRMGLGIAAAATTGGGPRLPAATPPSRRRVLRVAHITDVHVQPELGAGRALAQCFQHIHAQADKVDLILNTGDAVMDCFSEDAARTRLLWDLWNDITGRECRLPLRHVIGNHDIWGWNRKASRTSGDEPNWGKAAALAGYDMKQPYYSFAQGGWHFIALDSVMPHRDRYTGGLDDRQFEWLRARLEAVDPATPVLVYSHIPIFSVAAIMQSSETLSDQLVVPGGEMLLDHLRVKNLFKRHPNVKLCLSGHTHLIDQVQYLGVTYCCNGAVSGGWWKSSNDGECDAGYSLIDLYDDGGFEREYVSYGWKYPMAYTSKQGGL